MALPSYSVTLKKDSDSTTYDLTGAVISLPTFTDVCNDEANSAVIVFSAIDGQLVTAGNAIISQFDQIQIISLDGSGGSYGRVFEVRRMIPTKGKGTGNRLEVHLAGLEVNLFGCNYIKPFYFADGFTVTKDIGNYYNVNKGSKQPTLSGHDSKTQNKIADWTTTIYDYGLNQDKCYNRLLQTIDRLGASVDNGGALDFYDMVFDTPTFGAMNMRIFSSGSTDSKVILQNATAVNVGDTEAGINSAEGFLLCSWGAVGVGSLPPDYSRFASKEYSYPLYTQWFATANYPVNALVQWKGILYKALNPNISSQPDLFPANWQSQTKAQFYGNVIQYSPWTVQKANHWKNAGAGFTADLFGQCMWDGNLVIWTESAERTYAELITNNPANIPANYKYGGTNVYRGFRILCSGPPAGVLAGNGGKDVNGVSYTNAIVEYDGFNWTVKYSASTNLMCAIMYTGDVAQFDNALAPGAWVYIGQLAAGNDCFHPYDSLTNVTGIENDGTFTTNLNSAIAVQYSWNLVGADSTSSNWYKAGAWLCFRFPYPHNTINAIGETVGQLYGGSKATFQEPSTLDAQNMHMTHDGLRGFNNASAIDYGQLSALEFWTKMNYTRQIISGDELINEGNFKMRCLIYDTSDNVVFQDYVIPFNNTWQYITLPLGGFEIYRGLKPIWGPLDLIVPPKQVSAFNTFEWRNIKQIVLQTQESYDEQGRYIATSVIPIPIGPNRYTNPVSLQPSVTRKLIMTVDAFHFAKPLFVTSGAISDRSLEPEFLERPNMILYDQLQADNLAELEKARFQKREYDVTTTMKFDIPVGTSFWLRDPLVVPTQSPPDVAPDGVSANTIKLVAKRVEYSITKPDGGEGGAIRRLIGIKRFF